MAQGRSSSKTSNSEGSTVGSAARVRGRVLGGGDLTIEGHVEGDISLGGDLTIASGGSATSNVEAEGVVIAGALEGDVSARGPVRILAGAHVRGNLNGAHVSIEEGAEFAGRLDCEFDLPAELMQGEANATRGATARRR